MEIALTVLASLLGTVVGLLVADLVQRRKDRADLKKAAEDFRTSQEKLAELHNQVARDHKALSDKVSAHEMAFKARLTK